jgi:hypothetical protein
VVVAALRAPCGSCTGGALTAPVRTQSRASTLSRRTGSRPRPRGCCAVGLASGRPACPAGAALAPPAAAGLPTAGWGCRAPQQPADRACPGRCWGGEERGGEERGGERFRFLRWSASTLACAATPGRAAIIAPSHSTRHTPHATHLPSSSGASSIRKSLPHTCMLRPAWWCGWQGLK